MANPSSKKTVEEVKEAAEKVTASAPKRAYRRFLFQVSLFAALGAFAVLTLLVSTIPSFQIDLQIARALQSIDSPVFAALMRLISWPGFSPQSLIIPVMIAGLIYFFGWRWEALTTLVAAFLPAILNVMVKEWIRRPRPTVDLVRVVQLLESFSFPSGHVMFYVGFFGFLWFFAYTLLKRSVIRTLLLMVLSGLIGLVGLSRIYLGQHWPSDVLGAYLLGGLVLVAIVRFYNWGKQRFFLNQPLAAGRSKSIDE